VIDSKLFYLILKKKNLFNFIEKNLFIFSNHLTFNKFYSFINNFLSSISLHYFNLIYFYNIVLNYNIYIMDISKISKIKFPEIFKNYQTFLFDIDGVVWKGGV